MVTVFKITIVFYNKYPSIVTHWVEVLIRPEVCNLSKYSILNFPPYLRSCLETLTKKCHPARCYRETFVVKHAIKDGKFKNF